ncbi:MAG: hypothetical protein IK048_02210 [Clostridia bacterium]|nr:hypothetical protein [Clostridia bacterium]
MSDLRALAVTYDKYARGSRAHLPRSSSNLNGCVILYVGNSKIAQLGE